MNLKIEKAFKELNGAWPRNGRLPILVKCIKEVNNCQPPYVIGEYYQSDRDISIQKGNHFEYIGTIEEFEALSTTRKLIQELVGLCVDKRVDFQYGTYFHSIFITINQPFFEQEIILEKPDTDNRLQAAIDKVSNFYAKK